MLTDVYNLSHTDLKENTDYEISHIYNRSRGMILFGFNEIVIDLLNRKIQESMVIEADEYARRMKMVFPVDMWMRVCDELGGWIPLKVDALPDGTWCPKGTPFAKITNTDAGFGELVTWWEGVFLHSYFPSGCATEVLSLGSYLKERGTDTNKFHSFGWRGHRSPEDAYWSAKAWNMVMEGTDDFHGVQYTPHAGMSSIPATAHKTIQQFDNELDAFKHTIKACADKEYEAVSLVIDTYDPWDVINNQIPKILEFNQRYDLHLVFRPDSGDVIEQALAIWRHYGSKNENCSVIIGEGMDLQKIKEYDTIFKSQGVPLSFIAYGIGAGFYKHIDRDYLGFSMKTSYSNGKERMKLTISNPYKQSLPGDVNIVKEDGNLVVDYTTHGLYETVYEMDEHSSRPKYKTDEWCDIAKRVNHILNTCETLQEEIILSESVKRKIEEFRQKYLKNN